MPPICPPPVLASKKSTGQSSAARAALGGRTLKTGQSRGFVGYKKHTLRLWRHPYSVGVQLVPLVVADLAYWGATAKQQCREQGRVAILTKLRSDMKLVPPYAAWNQAACPQGEPLTGLGYEARAGEPWFGVGTEPELCGRGWAAARGLRQFADRPEQHETRLGRWPLASRLARHVLQPVRPWIEPAQSFEKNQPGLGAGFFNRLPFTWAMALRPAAAVLLRARALLGRPTPRRLLADLMPAQLSLELGAEAGMSIPPTQNPNPQNLQ
jgi:hypothetical protein